MQNLNEITNLNIPLPPQDSIPAAQRHYLDVCREKLGLIPNVLLAYTFDEHKFNAFVENYNNLMLGESGLSRLEREMIAVVVSSINHCYYCLVSHGQSVRSLADDPILGEILTKNYRAAQLSTKHKAMLDFAAKLTKHPDEIEQSDRAALRKAGFSERDIFDIASVIGFFNMSNRVGTALAMEPNVEYHSMNR